MTRGGALAIAALLAGCGGPERDPVPTASRAVERQRPQAPAAATPTPEGTPRAEPSLAVAPAMPPAPGSASYPPRDECAKLPGFTAFRDTLLGAIRRRDADALVALADPAIRLDFGGGAGAEELRKRLGEPRGELWGELASLAALGCAADSGLATLPWIFARVPEATDPYRTLIVLGADVPMKAKASAAANEVGKLDWALVEVAGQSFDPKARFVEVTTASGARGFVEGARLRSVLDYRLIAERQGETWRISALVAGD